MRIYIHIVSNKRNKNNTWEMHPPRPKPSKNWWKVNAATRGLIVFGLSEAPREMPIITECTTIPNSKTYTQNFVQTFLSFKELLYIFLTFYQKKKRKKEILYIIILLSFAKETPLHIYIFFFFFFVGKTHLQFQKVLKRCKCTIQTCLIHKD